MKPFDQWLNDAPYIPEVTEASEKTGTGADIQRRMAESMMRAHRGLPSSVPEVSERGKAHKAKQAAATAMADYGLLAPGVYEAEIISACVKGYDSPTLRTTRTSLRVVFQVQSPEGHVACVGRSYLLQDTGSPDHCGLALSISKAELVAAASAIGVTELADTDQLVGGKLLVRVGVYHLSHVDKAFNTITGTYKLNEGAL
jgi:hypothetical protein